MATHTDPAKAADARPLAKDDMQKLPMADVVKRLGSSSEGLSDDEAKKRLAQFGPNEIADKKTSAIIKFLGYLWGPIPWMIEVAVVLSGAVRHWPDFFIILLLLFANAMIGFWEERQAGNAIEALKAGSRSKRGSSATENGLPRPPRELVPGDVDSPAPRRHRSRRRAAAARRRNVGRSVRADRRVVAGHAKSGDAVFSGSIVRRGEIDALVYATGPRPILARRRSWSRRRSPSAISRRRC